jgi:hypothetical protein
VPPGPNPPLRLLLWLNHDSPCFGNNARKSFRTACMHASTHVLRCARYETRTTNCAPHMRLTILNPLHAKQCHAGMHLLQRFVRRRLGWHAAFDTVQVCQPLPQSQHTRCFTGYTDACGFTHQRRPYGRPSSCATTRSMLPQPSQNPFSAQPLDDCGTQTTKLPRRMKKTLQLSPAQPRLFLSGTAHERPVRLTLM